MGAAGNVDKVLVLPTAERLTRNDAVQRYDHLFKIILIGDQSVGKTNLTLRFCFQEYSPSYVATIGVDFKVRTVDIGGKRVKLQIWDTAGQERFKTISRIYYRGAHGAIFVFDVSNRTSFENVRDWISTFHDVNGEGESNSDTRKIIVGNKCDRVGARQISQDHGEHLARRFKMKYYETSAKTGQNVEETFAALAKDILLQQEKKRREQLPSTVTSKINNWQSRARKRSWSWSKCNIL